MSDRKPSLLQTQAKTLTVSKSMSNNLPPKSSKQSRHQPSDSPQRPAKTPRTIDGEDSSDEEESNGMNPVNRNAQRYLIAVEYNGTGFLGAQKQAKGRTVVGSLEEAFRKFVGKPVSIYCSSRTDTGVHALSNVFHVDFERTSKRKPGEILPPYEPSVVKNAVNHFLQKTQGTHKSERDIALIDVRCVPADFHARFKALERTYYYRLLSGDEPLSVFEKDRAWHVPEELNLFAMQQACKVFVGCHDFSSFRGAACQAKSPIKSLDELTVVEMPLAPSFPPIVDQQQITCSSRQSLSCSDKIETKSSVAPGNSDQHIVEHSLGEVTSPGFGGRRTHRCLVVTARSRSFLYHQVRLMVGVLKAVGTGNLTVPDVQRILDAKNVAAVSPMAPACGLYLGQVKYDLP